MSSVYDDLIRITAADSSADVRRLAMRGFAEQLHWTPSYEFHGTFGVEAAGDHLVVEHGLSNAAVISFLKAPKRVTDLDAAQLRSLLAISYNNLVEWHIFVSQTDVRRINNLGDPSANAAADQLFSISPHDLNRSLSAEEIDRLVDLETWKRTQRACDDALIQVVGRWKRLLKADYPQADNPALSTLFNGVIFVRGCEDRRYDDNTPARRDLLRLLAAKEEPTVNMAQFLAEAMLHTGVDGQLQQFIDVARLGAFAAVDKATALNLFRDFYAPREAPYDFNFALMSKHALSRIYERYVALLRDEESDDRQYHFISPTPIDEAPLKTGAVYTPQFIAGFFARYVRENMTPRSFRSLKALDPACGSGIFLRSLLELQCNPFEPAITKATIKDAFKNTSGIDRDPNACEAARLSLALLHLVATGELPAELSIETAEAVGKALAGTIAADSYGAVISNPPYIKHEFLGDAERDIFREYLGESFKGRLDAYLAFVKLSLTALTPGGLACFVLPQVFLNAANAAPLRRMISTNFDVRCLVDLSAVPVFEGVGAYSILLIVQRHPEGAWTTTSAQLAQVTEFVGAALQACLDGTVADTPYYKVFEVPQSFFRSKDWVIVSPSFLAIDQRLRNLPQLAQYTESSQGYVSGADDVFIRNIDDVPVEERSIYMEFLPDKSIRRYSLPKAVNQLVFYPYVGEKAVTPEDLESQFPITWDYLTANNAKLSARGPVQRGSTPWWRPERPREPNRMRRRKIVCPHLMLTPRFAVDESGRFAVSRSPFVVLKEAIEDESILRLLAAILNSSVASWYFRTYAPKYAQGYSRIELTLLKSLPVPDLSSVDPSQLRRISAHVERLENQSDDPKVEQELDEMIAQLYGFTTAERRILLGDA